MMHLDAVTVFACEGFHFDETESPSYLIRVKNTPLFRCRPVVHLCVCVCLCMFVCVCVCPHACVISKIDMPHNNRHSY